MEGGVAETETPFTYLQDSHSSTWIRRCYFKIKKLHNIAG